MASRKGWAAYLLVALIVGLGVLSPASSISAAGQAVHPLSQPASTSASVVSKTNHISRMAASTNTTSTDIVTNANDSGRGSLRDTIANASVGDTITFVPGLGTITLTSGAITLTHDLVIDGSAALFQVIHGNDTAIFVIPPGIRVMLTSLTIAKGGLYWPHLSAIINNGTLAVYHCNLVDNTAWGAIVNLGALIVENSYFGWNDGYGIATGNRGHAADLLGGAVGDGNGTTRPCADGRPRRGARGAVSGIGWAGIRRRSARWYGRSATPAAIAGVRSR